MNEYRDKAQDKDWEQVSELLHRADCVPDAPDCRSAVMAHIAKPKPVLRYRWAYATGFAALVVAAVGITPFLRDSGQRDRIAYTPTAKLSAPAPTAKPETKSFALAPKAIQQQGAPRSVKRIKHNKPVMMAIAPPTATRMRTRESGLGAEYYARPERPKFKSTAEGKFDAPVASPGPSSLGDRAMDSPRAAVAAPARRIAPGGSVGSLSMAEVSPSAAAKDEGVPNYSADNGAVSKSVASATAARATASGSYFAFDASEPAPSRPASASRARPAEHAVAGTPVAVAMVAWPSNDSLPGDSYNYAYTNRDTATGTTTECRVKRSGNSVEIYMESKPAVTEPPVKGNLDHEAVPSA